MADVSDIERALTSLAGSILYPSGTASPSVAGVPIRIFRGWPIAKALDDDLRAGRVCVSVSPMNQGRDVTRVLDEWESDPATPSISATLGPHTDGQRLRITLGGSPRAGDAVGFRAGGEPVVVPVLSSDTLAAIATRLAAAIPNAEAQGATIALPWHPRAEVRVGCPTVSRREVRRTTERFRLVVWASTPQHRDSVGSALDLGLSGLDFLPLDGEPYALLRRQASMIFDDASESRLFRRDVVVEVEFAAHETRVAPTLLFGMAVTVAVNASATD